MLDSINPSQTDNDANTQALILHDYELNGTINRAANEGAKFALILAMLEQDCTHRPQIEKNKALNDDSDVASHSQGPNHYRSNPLSANDAYWQTSQQTSQLFNSGQLHSAQLWLAMHPEPLSQHNKPDVIGPEVIANCGLNTQQRLQASQEKTLKQNEAGLYDILQELEQVSA